MEKMVCKNCGKLVKGNFCGHCGQDSKVGKINLRNFLNEFSESVFLINKGFFYTLINLFKHPGQSIKDFLNGKRKIHFKPVAYVLTLSTLYFLISRLTGENTWMNDVIFGFSLGANDLESNLETPPMLIWLAENFAYTTLIMLPVYSLASYLSFLGLGRNYLEHIILNAYTTGQQAIFYSFFLLLNIFITSKYLEVAPVFISISYNFWVFWQFFVKGNRMVNILRTLLTYALYLIFSLGLLFVINGIQLLID
jgi:hypothetical protein